MKSRRSKHVGATRSAITRIWMGLAEESISRDGRQVDAAEAQKALDRAAEWMVAHLREHGILADAGRDGALRTLDFEDEAACLEAHERKSSRGKLVFSRRRMGTTRPRVAAEAIGHRAWR